MTIVGEGGRAIRLDAMSGYGTSLLPGLQGVGLAPVELGATALPDRDGSIFRYFRLGEREIGIPLHIWGESYANVRDTRRNLEAILYSRKNPLQVVIAQPDTGERRTAYGYYTGGMEGSYGEDEFGHNFQKFGLVIRCLDPWFYKDPVTRIFRIEGALGATLSSSEAFFPFMLSQSTYASGTNFVNEGDGDAYPIWTITGPKGNLIALNETTGQRLEVTGLDSGSIVTIDTRPSIADIYDQDGNDLWDSVSVQSSLWPLVPGNNFVKITFSEADPTTEVRLQYAVPVLAGN